MREVVEMAQILLEMGTDIYMKSKYALLAISSKHPTDRVFFDVLFDRIDKKRPLAVACKSAVLFHIIERRCLYGRKAERQ